MVLLRLFDFCDADFDLADLDLDLADLERDIDRADWRKGEWP